MIKSISLLTRKPGMTHEQILELQLILFDELFRLAVESPVRWTR